MLQNEVHLEGLNGLRAIAASAVIISHININLHKFSVPDLPSTKLAGFGVTIFFAISGFLITYLFLKEKSLTGRMDIGKFYKRRALRLLPLYFFFITLCLCLFNTQYLNANLLYYLFFAANILFITTGSLPSLEHFWSLGVELQFYFFWPFLIKYTEKIFQALSLFIGVFLGVKIFFNLYFGDMSLPYSMIYTTRFDCMAIGGIGAFSFLQCPKVRDVSQNIIIQLLCWLVLLLLLFNYFHIYSIVDHEIVALVTALLIINQAGGKKRMVNLEIQPMAYLGRISFGLYVYHPLIVFLLSHLSFGELPLPVIGKYFLIYFLVLSASIIISHLSYIYIEKPFLKIKTKYSIIKNTDF